MKPIYNYIHEKRKEGYCGSIKLSFENGRLVTVNEANRFDVLTDKVNDDQKAVDECLSKASDPSYNGSIVLVLRDGIIYEYSHLRTYKGRTLEKLMEEYR